VPPPQKEVKEQRPAFDGGSLKERGIYAMTVKPNFDLHITVYHTRGVCVNTYFSTVHPQLFTTNMGGGNPKVTLADALPCDMVVSTNKK
jgi:hypothetical protein